MLKPPLQKIVELLCQDGCKLVNDYIEDIEANNMPAVMESLNKDEQAQVLNELKSIMNVYQRGDS